MNIESTCTKTDSRIETLVEEIPAVALKVTEFEHQDEAYDRLTLGKVGPAGLRCTEPK